MRSVTTHSGLLLFVGLLSAPVLPNPAVALLLGAAIAMVSGLTPEPLIGKASSVALQSAIVLLGFKLQPERLMELSREFSVVVSAWVVGCVAVGWLLARMLTPNPVSAQLLASGTAICGGTTIAALSPIVEAHSEETAVALSLVFLLNSVALFCFPLIGHALGLSDQQFGVFAALAIHDTSSVVATAARYSEESMLVAATVKLGRTLWLIPAIIVFSALYRRKEAKLRFPLFVLFFVMAAMCSPLISETPVAGGLVVVSTMLLNFSLFTVGSQMTRTVVSQLRGRAVVYGVSLWSIVVPISLAVAYLLPVKA